MRFSQFSENSAMDSTVRIMQKTFSPERRQVQDKVLEVVRMVQMEKGDKMELARAITELAKSELEVKRQDPDLEISVEQNLGMLDRAMKAVTGMSEGITEEELEEYKSMATLRNRSNLDALARLQDKKKSKEPKIIELPKGTQLDLFKKAAGESLELDEEKGDYVITLKGKEMFRGKSEKDARSAFHKLRKEHGNDVKVKVEESLEPQAITEEEFDVLAEKKDACYHKVKARYKVWPSAYASGALVQCRKKGAANWGNSKKK